MTDILDLYLQFESGNAPDFVIHDYNEVVVKGKTFQIYRQIIQYGKKEGESLFAHIMKGVFVLETLRPQLHLSEVEARVLYTAYTIHDLNKTIDQQISFSKLVTPERVAQEIERLELARFLPDWNKYLADITTLIRSHGGHSSVGGEILNVKNKARYGLLETRVETLVSLMRAADVLSLSDTLQERKHKSDFLSSLNRFLADANIPEQYEFHTVQFAEQRGILTNVIHNTVGDVLKDLGWIPLLLYAQGVAYLAPKNTNLKLDSETLARLGQQIDQSLRFILSNDPANLIEQTPQGIKFTPDALKSGLSFDLLFQEVRSLVSRRRFKLVELDSNARKRIQGALDKLTKSNPDLAAWFRQRLADRTPLIQASDDQLRAAELARTYFIFLSTYFAHAVSDAWLHLYHLLELPSDQEAYYNCFDARYDRPYILAGAIGLSEAEVYHRIVQDGIPRLKTTTAENSDDVLLWVDYLRRYMAVDGHYADSGWSDHLIHYLESQHGQCIHCSSPFDVVKWRTSDVREDIAIQKFSNRLLGGIKGEPVKSICKVCRIQFLIEAMNFPSIRGETVYYLHLVPRTYQSPLFMQGLGNAFNHIRSRGINIQALNMNVDDVYQQLRRDQPLTPIFVDQTKAGKAHPYGLYVPKYSESLGNVLIMPLNAPGDNDTEKYLFALWYALVLGNFFEANVILSKDPVPPLSADNLPALYLDSAPIGCMGLIRHSAYQLQGSETDPLSIQWLIVQANHLFAIRERLSPAKDEKPTLVRAMTDGCLYVFHVADRLMEDKVLIGDAFQDTFRHVRELATAIGGNWMQKLSEILNNLARLAWENRLRGATLKRSSLLYPTDEVLSGFPKLSMALDTETLIAATAQNIFNHTERISEDRYKPGEKVYNAAEAFVRGWYEQVLGEVYRGNVPSLIRDAKLLRSAYLFYVQSHIPQKSDKER